MRLPFAKGVLAKYARPPLLGLEAAAHAPPRLGQTSVVAMLMSKHEIVRMLLRAGLTEAAEDAERSLPDEVELERAAAFGARYGITRDELISRMGGSP